MIKNLAPPALIFLWLLACWLLMPHEATAHPPQDIALSYDASAQTLTVTITHSSTFARMHYIKQVQVKKNNDPVEKHDYASQTDQATFAYEYKIPATVNDRLEVTALCNVRGLKAAALVVGQPKN